jgi:hypothetical protein
MKPSLGKLSEEAWVTRCRKLGIAGVELGRVE